MHQTSVWESVVDVYIMDVLLLIMIYLSWYRCYFIAFLLLRLFMTWLFKEWTQSVTIQFPDIP